MSLPVDFRDSAIIEAEEAHDWYQSRREGLGARVVALLTSTAELLSRFPEAAPEVHQGVRRVLVPVFNYRVYYVIEPERVLIIGIRHPARKEPDWRNFI